MKIVGIATRVLGSQTTRCCINCYTNSLVDTMAFSLAFCVIILMSIFFFFVLRNLARTLTEAGRCFFFRHLMDGRGSYPQLYIFFSVRVRARMLLKRKLECRGAKTGKSRIVELIFVGDVFKVF